jgi:2-methylaconitate cis-trans-isomerase PrpF
MERPEAPTDRSEPTEQVGARGAGRPPARRATPARDFRDAIQDIAGPEGRVGRGTPIALIRAGTSRGMYVRREDLPGDPVVRDSLLLRFFGAQDGEIADGVGGERPALRKLGIIDRVAAGSDGIPVLTYTFGQVAETLTGIDYGAECGNIAAGIPLFASLYGWCAGPEQGGSAWLHMLNTGKRLRAEWAPGDRHGGAVRLVFVDPVPRGADGVLPLGTTIDRIESEDGSGIRFSVVSALNDYVFIDSRDIGVADPVSMEVTNATFESIAGVLATVASRFESHRVLKVCLVAPVSERSGFVRARILYPRERWSHPGFAVTGAVTLAVACCLRGSVLEPCEAELGPESLITIEHPGGAATVRWALRPDGFPETVSLRRSCRLVLRGMAY